MYDDSAKEKRLKSLIDDQELVIVRNNEQRIVGVVEYSYYHNISFGQCVWLTVSISFDEDAQNLVTFHLKELLHRFKQEGVSMVVVGANDEVPHVQKMMEHIGFASWYGYVSMVFDGSALPKSKLNKRQIEKNDFDTYFDEMGTCFAVMRRALDLQPYNITEIYFQSEQKRQETFDEWIGNQDQTFMYEKDGQWVGCGLLNNREIDDVFVLPQFQHQGYGREIVYDLIDVAQKKGITPQIGFIKWNKRAQQLYESCGFIPYLSQTMYRVFL